MEFKKVIKESNGKVIPVPANMTHIFQPLDLTVNRASKAFLRKSSQDWYSNEIRKEMEKGNLPQRNQDRCSHKYFETLAYGMSRTNFQQNAK